MPDLPTGTVTFLFTDIEGSTRLLQHLGDRYAAVLAEHQRLKKGPDLRDPALPRCLFPAAAYAAKENVKT